MIRMNINNKQNFVELISDIIDLFVGAELDISYIQWRSSYDGYIMNYQIQYVLPYRAC